MEATQTCLFLIVHNVYDNTFINFSLIKTYLISQWHQGFNPNKRKMNKLVWKKFNVIPFFIFGKLFELLRYKLIKFTKFIFFKLLKIQQRGISLLCSYVFVKGELYKVSFHILNFPKRNNPIKNFPY